MITSEGPRGRFLIATPTKCGTTTLEEMCRRHRGGRAGVPVDTFRIMDWESPRRQHRMSPPLGWDDAERYLMVRNPFERYMSMYEYLKAPHNYSKFGAKEIQRSEWRGWLMGREGVRGRPMDFEQFLWWLADARAEYGSGRWIKRRGSVFEPRAFRSPWVWLDSLTDSLEALRMQGGGGEVTVLRLENFWQEMSWLVETWGLRDVSTRASIRANRTLTYAGGGRAYYGATCSARAWGVDGEWLGGGRVGDCGRCAACAVGATEEAVVLGYA